MTITFEDIQRILSLARENNVKVKIFFENYPYVLSIDRVIHAEDYKERNISWIYAFGSKQPHQVLNSFSVKKIVIIKDNEILEVKSLQDLYKQLR